MANPLTVMHMSIEPWLLYSAVTVLSLAIGSFFNVLIHRLPIMMEKDWHLQCNQLLNNQTDIEQETYNLMVPRSACPHCNHKICWYENIPVISYLLLKGRCKNCKAGISLQYPLIEILTTVIAIICVLQFGVSWQGISAIIFSWLLLVLTTIDFKTSYLPDQLTYPLLWLGLLLSTQSIFIDPQQSIIGATIGYLTLWSVYQLFKLVTGKEGMGHGDFKLLAALGAWLGIYMLPAIIIISSLAGSIIGIALIAIQGRDSQKPMPFGPYLAVAGWICLTWGDKINQSILGF